MTRPLSKAEMLRKLLHLFALGIPFGIYYVPGEIARIMLPTLTLVFLGTDILRITSPFFGRWVTRIFAPFMREHEKVALTGAAYIFIAGTIALFAFPKDIAFIVLSFVILGDAAAALVGIPCGRTRVGKKSVEGALACFAACVVLWWGFPKVPFGQGMLCAFLTALLELSPLPIDDNLAVPLITGTFLTLLFSGTRALMP
jgi:dolichol kinase